MFSIMVCGSLLLSATPVLNIGSHLELMVDYYLIETLKNTDLRLQTPQPGENVFQFNKPWEGRFCGYTTVFKAKGKYHMYYRGLPHAGQDCSASETTCYAESKDGIHWSRPSLGIYEVAGTRDNNVVLANMPPFSHNFAPFYDVRPGVSPEERYKALAGTGKSGLHAFVSPDGLHWKKVGDKPVITEGAFDSHNVAFWSEKEGCYLCYFRVFDRINGKGVRSVARTTSPDFIHWTPPVEMEYGDTPRENLYTNETHPYFREPGIYISIAARFMPGRRVVSPEMMKALGGNVKYSGDCSDAILMTSRGGNHYDRTFMEGFLRPGIGYENWTSRTNYPAYGLVAIDDHEMAFYVNRNYGQDSAYLQRMILRTDGFAALHAPYAGGEMITKPFIFTGNQLVLNYSTSAAGSIWVEILGQDGKPVEGYTLADSDEIIGDEIARVVTWRGHHSDVSSLAGKPVRLHFKMKDADIFSLKFEQKQARNDEKS